MIDSRLPYQIAMNIYKQGTECDHAARLIRQRLPNFLTQIRLDTMIEMGKDYKKEWEEPIMYGY